MTTKTKDYEVGDTIAYLSYNVICVGRVIAKHKNEFEIISCVTGNVRRGYNTQIVNVPHKKEK